jgi:hypothetical protein
VYKGGVLYKWALYKGVFFGRGWTPWKGGQKSTLVKREMKSFWGRAGRRKGCWAECWAGWSTVQEGVRRVKIEVAKLGRNAEIGSGRGQEQPESLWTMCRYRDSYVEIQFRLAKNWLLEAARGLKLGI